jgi:hypothetical protein
VTVYYDFSVFFNLHNKYTFVLYLCYEEIWVQHDDVTMVVSYDQAAGADTKCISMYILYAMLCPNSVSYANDSACFK